MAATERIDPGYLGRILQLTLLAPDIVEALLDGRQRSELGLPTLMEPFPLGWERQRASLEPQLGSARADGWRSAFRLQRDEQLVNRAGATKPQ